MKEVSKLTDEELASKSFEIEAEIAKRKNDKLQKALANNRVRLQELRNILTKDVLVLLAPKHRTGCSWDRRGHVFDAFNEGQDLCARCCLVALMDDTDGPGVEKFFNFSLQVSVTNYEST